MLVVKGALLIILGEIYIQLGIQVAGGGSGGLFWLG